MQVLVISCSLNTESRSHLLAQASEASLRARGVEVDFIDLRSTSLPLCDAGPAYAAPDVERLGRAIREADAVLLAVPIYNYDVNAAAKNMIELTGRAWTEKLVGFMCAAGGRGSYMSVMSLANSLMLDFRCLIVPRFVYATKADFAEDGIASDDVTERIDELCEATARLAGALRDSEAAGREARSLGG